MAKETNKKMEKKDAPKKLGKEVVIKARGKTFQGKVIKKLHGRVTIGFERLLYLRKYEGYEKRKTKIHARLPKELENEISVGDFIEIAECRPLSKIIHFIVIKKIRGKEKKE